jgi:hypothetical protein
MSDRALVARELGDAVDDQPVAGARIPARDRDVYFGGFIGRDQVMQRRGRVVAEHRALAQA